MELLIQQLDIEVLGEEELETGFSVVNNACWSCGEIALQQGDFYPSHPKIYCGLTTYDEYSWWDGSICREVI